MKVYNKVQRVSELPVLDKILPEAQVLLAHLRKNYTTSLSSINQKKIISAFQSNYTSFGKEVPISLQFKDDSLFRIMIKNGSRGEIGRTGKTGPDGDKGDYPKLNNNYVSLEKGEVIDWLTIANDCLTDDSNKVISAFQGIKINEALEKITETFLTEYQYALLFTDHVTIDAEFETYENNQLVQLIAEDKDSHKRYVKYWTFESEGEQEYYTLNYHTQNYDSVYADIWNDIYLGGSTGFFEATSAQLNDGTPLYVKNGSNYDLIEQFADTIYIFNGDEYVPSSLTEGSGPWFIKEYLKVNGEYKENYRQVSEDYINKNKDKVFGQKDFIYYVSTADCYVDVHYTQADGYDFNLHANNLPENIWVFDHVDSDGNNVYSPTTFANVDVNSPTVYYKKENNKYEAISNVKEYIKKKPVRYYKLVNGIWNEIEIVKEISYNEDGKEIVNESIAIDFDNYEEYIKVEYDEFTNTNKFYNYKHVKTIRDEYYDIKGGILTPYTIKYFVEYTENEPRKYFERKVSTRVTNTGETIFEYIYKEIIIPFWLEAEFITLEEDQDIRLLSNNPENPEEGDYEVIDPIYISSIEFEENKVQIAKNYNKDIKVNVFPTNANVTNMILEYDDSIINIYEDGRIAALTDNSISKETTIKVYSERDKTIGDEIKIEIVTPIESISIGVDEINLYPNTSFNLNPIIYPAIVSNNKLKYVISDPDMLMIDNKNNLTPKKINNTFKTGKCTLSIIAEDGFGAKLDIPVLVAVPITKIEILSNAFGFVGRPFTIETKVDPADATLILLDYKSSNEDVLKINSNGIITPLAEGVATITCSSKDGSGVSATQQITVTRAVDKIEIKDLDNSIEVGLTNDIEINVLPENATNKQIEIIVSDNSVIDYTSPILKEGYSNVYTMSIKGIKGGSTQFTVKSVDGANAIINRDLTIPIPIEKISFEEPEVVIYLGDSMKTIRTIVTGPSNVQNLSFEWYTSDASIVTVDNNGRIKPVKEGKAKISAISNDNNKVIGTCNVTVKIHTSGIKLNNGNINTKQLLLNTFGFIPSEVSPWNATDQIINWTSSNELVCIVQDNGTIYGKGLGEAIITATAIDNTEISESINIEVVKEIHD